MLDLLAGLRVVECSAFVAAPLCGNTLANLGAEVIRIDPLQGGVDYRRWPVTEAGASLYWVGLNNAKRSVAIDLRSEEGQALAKAIITAPGEGGGIFSTNLAPPWARYDDLKALRPDLIMLSVEGHPDGRSAVDYTVNTETGLPFITGNGSRDAPVNHSLPAWDLTTGLYGATALLSADRRRQRMGEGAHLKLSLSDMAFAMMATLGYTAEVEVNGKGRDAVGNHVYGTFGRDFVTRDGARLMIVAVTLRQWQGLGRATGLEAELAAMARQAGLDFTREGDRFKGRDAIADRLVAWFAAHDVAEIESLFAKNGVCWGPYQSVEELVRSDPRFTTTENPVFEKVAHPGVGTFTSAGPVVRVSGSSRGSVPPVSALGQDTREVLRDVLGLPNREIDRLRDGRVIGEARER